jgi:predicted transcriptional regulator
MKVLLSIKPEYSRKIFAGEKKYEFRKRKPRGAVELIFVYESSPTRCVVGGFSVRRIHSGAPDRIWQKCRESSGIEKKTYEEYCNGNKVIHAIEIDKIFRFPNPINPFEINSDFKPPQDFSYFKHTSMFKMLENKCSLLASPTCSQDFGLGTSNSRPY